MLLNEKIHIGNLGADLVHEPNPLSKRLQALSQLQEIAITQPFTYDTIRAIKSITAGLYCDSVLIKQKCVHALGQSRYPAVVPILHEQLAEKNADVVVRVEAARGLALVRYPGQEVQSIIELLKVRYDDEEVEMLRDAAEVAAARMGWELKREDEEEGGKDVVDNWFGEIDLAPPLPQIPEEDPIDHLSSILLCETGHHSLFTRLRALTSLRNLCIISSPTPTWAPDSTISLIAQTLTHAHQSTSTFLRYQLLLTLGQISHEATLPYLLYQLQNEDGEDERVRAIAAEMLGDFTYEKEVVDFLRDFEEDESMLVRECVGLVLGKAEILV